MIKGLLFVGWLAACSGDAVSTHQALVKGAHEVLLTQNPWVNDALLGGAGVAGAEMTRRHYTKHKTLVTVLGIAGIAWHAFLTMHNLQVVR